MENGPARLIETDLIGEPERGSLAAFENDALPFPVRRLFMVNAVPEGAIRGDHAHRTCHELLVAGAGRIEVSTHDGTAAREWTLDSPATALYVPPMTWCTQHSHSRDAVLVVLASHPYAPDDYVRDYEVFRAERGAG